MKRSLIISGIVFIILLAGVIFYLFFWAPQTGDKVLKNLFPFGKPEIPEEVEEEGGPNLNNNPSTQESGVGEEEEDLLQEGEMADFILLSSIPVAGFEPIIKETEEGKKNIAVRYIERDQGYIYQIRLDGSEKIRISNIEILNIYDSYWSEDGKYFTLRYLANNKKTIKSYFVDLSSYKKNTDYTLKGSFLPDNIQDFAFLSKIKKALFITPTEEGSLLSTIQFENEDINKIFTSLFSEWLIQWPLPEKIALTTKASTVANGYLYSLIPGTGNMVKILGGIRGLTTLVSPDFQHILYSRSTRGSFDLYLYDTQTKSSLKLFADTLPEKCVWVNKEIFYCAIPKEVRIGSYPDDWYQGQINFRDDIMKFKVGSPSPIETFSLSTPIDAVNLDLEGDYLFFIDRTTGFLWARKVVMKNELDVLPPISE